MAEAIAAFAAISSVFQVIDFTGKLVKLTHTLLKSKENTHHEVSEVERLARDLQSLSITACNASGSSRASSPTNAELAVLQKCEECRDEAGKLLSMLDEFKVQTGATGVKRVLEGTRKSARVIRRRQDIERKRKLLVELNGQLHTALLSKVLEDTSRRASSSEDICEDDAERLGETTLEKELRAQDKFLLSLQDESLPELERVAILRQEVTRYKARYIVDKALAFDDMHERRAAIPIAFGKTYNWILEDDELGLAKWLESGNKIFWIGGKAGSGKSTLMKYLASHYKTRQLLTTWARSQGRLVFAEFYFWYLGSTLQKSISGLLRSIIYQMLLACPELVKSVFPQQWNDPGLFTHFQQDPPWVEAKLMNTLKYLSEASASTTEKEGESAPVFCFFIDGLDEYHGHHPALVQLLAELETNPRIKLCVSSRPWNAFRNAYRHKEGILLETLTRSDITAYVEGKLSSLAIESSPPILAVSNQQTLQALNSDRTELIDEIVRKAEGVFLWVYLAVQSVLHGHAEGDSIVILRDRVRELPSDLEDFFTAILSRVDRVYARQTAQALKLAYIQATPDQGSDQCLDMEFETGPSLVGSFLNYWFMRQFSGGLLDPDFPFRFTTRLWSRNEFDRIYHETQDFLSACCKDLLYLSTPRKRPESAILNTQLYKVEFLHRTVYDFLCADQMQDMLRTRLPAHFNDKRIFHMLNLAQAKVVPDWVFPQSLATAFKRRKLFSISTTWNDCPNKYVEDLDKVERHWMDYFHSSKVSSLPKPKWDMSCASWQLYVASFGQDDIQVLQWDESYILSAALGFSPRKPFDLQFVDLSLVERLLSLGASLSDPCLFPCKCSLRHRFRTAWVASLSTTDEVAQRKVWSLASILLRDSTVPDFIDLAGRLLRNWRTFLECSHCTELYTFDSFYERRTDVARQLRILCPADSREELEVVLVDSFGECVLPACSDEESAVSDSNE